MTSGVLKWEFDLSARPTVLVDRCAATMRLSNCAKEVAHHQTPTFIRQAIVGSCLSFSLEQQNSVGLLVATGRDSAAALLIRPIFESLCVSAWALYCVKNDQLVSIMSGRTRFPALSSLISQLEQIPDCDWIGFRQRSANVAAFHSLAHPSMLQLSRRYSEDCEATAFSLDECLKLLWLADTLSISCVAVTSVALGSDGMEAWSSAEMGKLMHENEFDWEGWRDLPRSKMPLGPPTIDFIKSKGAGEINRA